MDFKKGEQVKAFCKLGLQKEAKWNVMTYDSPFHVKGPGQFRCHATQIRHFRRLEQKEGEKYAQDNIHKLLVYIKRGMERLLPKYADEVTLNSENTVINLPCGLTVEPCVVEVESLDSFTEFPGWSVISWRQVTATRNEPEGIDGKVMGEARYEMAAAALAIKSVFSALSDGFWEGEGEIEYVRQLEEEKRHIEALYTEHGGDHG